MRVLMVDDEDDIRQVGQLSLRSVGKFDTRLASSAAQALEMIEQDPPDVVLMDMMMPGMDGLGALAAIRSNPDTQSIPVIFMTAKVQRHEIEEYIAAGALGVIQKPFDPMTLPDEVRRLMAERDE